MSQETLPGFEAYDNIMAGLQEKATTELYRTSCVAASLIHAPCSFARRW